MSSPTKLLLIRHAENPANVTHEFSYRLIDYSLNEKGRLQAQQTAAFLASEPIAAVWASPLKRAVETAAPIAAAHGLAIQQSDDFREVNVGSFEGHSTPENWARHDEIVLDWMVNHNTTRRFPDGENYDQLLARFRRGLRQMLDHAPGQTQVLVGHGGLFSFCMRDIVGNFDPLILKTKRAHNCSITTIHAHLDAAGAWQATMHDWANADHLSGDAAVLVAATPTNKWDQLEE